MHSGSKFVYVYDESSSESEDEGISDAEKEESQKKSRKIDTNVIKIDFKNLQSHSYICSSQPNVCDSCPAIATSGNDFTNDLSSQLNWTCKYCGTVNSAKAVTSVDNKNDTSYFINEIANSSRKTSAQVDSEVDLNDTTLICFCIDTSASMDRKIYQGSVDLSFTRLNALKEAVLQQIDYLHAHKPNVKILLITFGSTVSHHDPINSSVLNSIASIFKYTGEQKVITEDLVNEKDKIIKIGKNIPKPLAIKQTKAGITKVVKNLKTDGCTALGPALLLAVSSCSRFHGSKIILCTDGEANKGLGSFSIQTSNPNDFYNYVGQYVKDNGNSISLLTIGENSKIAQLGSIVAATNGTVKVVDPIDLGGEFREIIDDRLIAINMKSTLILPKQFYIRNYGSLKSKDNNYQTFEIGNVTQKKEYGIEFGIKRGIDRSSIGENVCFQLILNYSDRDGNRICRVYEKSLKITKDREEAEENADLEVITVNAMQQAARMQILGKLDIARSRLVGQERFFARQERWHTIEANRILAFGNQHVKDYLNELIVTNETLAMQRERQSDESAAKMFQTLVFDKSKI